MTYLNNSAQWEEFFIQEAVELEEKMKSLDVEALNKSKLRICLENNILEWAQYEKWYMSKLGCCSLKMTTSDEDLERFIKPAKLTNETYSNYDFWNEDLIPFLIWDNQLVVLGLHYNENLVKIENHIFILAPPQILSYLKLKLSGDSDMFQFSEPEGDVDEKSISEDSGSSRSILDGISLDASAPKISFKPTEMVSVFAPLQSNAQPEAIKSSSFPTGSNYTPVVDKSEAIWEFITERHSEFSFEARKQFDAFVVLKIFQNKTQVFKMDHDLSKMGINPLIFEYTMSIDGPFKKVFDAGRSSFFTLSQLHMKLAGFEHACITPLKRGKLIVGFIVGFKKDQLSQQDQSLLEDIAQETAS